MGRPPAPAGRRPVAVTARHRAWTLPPAHSRRLPPARRLVKLPALLFLATSSSGDIAIGVSVVSTVVVIALLAALVAAVRSARQLRRAADQLRREGMALLAELDATVTTAGRDLERVDDLIGSAERLSATVGSASRLARMTMATPVIKVMALGAGTARVSDRIRGRRRGSRREIAGKTGRRRSGVR